MLSFRWLIVAYILIYSTAHGLLPPSTVGRITFRFPDGQQSIPRLLPLFSLKSPTDHRLRLKDQSPIDCSSMEASLASMGVNTSVQVLSADPLIYTVPNLLTERECENYRQYVRNKEEQGREMTRSNPPDVSLDLKKLWPLPLLSLLGGIPSCIRFIDTREGSNFDFQEAVFAISPSIAFSLMAMGTLVFLAVPFIRKISDQSARTSVAMALNLEQDVDMIQPFVERASTCVLLPKFSWRQWEAPVVTRYDAGAVFARHGDASPSRGSEWKDLGGQRLVTCICYLNSLDQGGETYFDQLGIAVSPRAGTALFFYPADVASCLADERTTHESLPPKAKKWIVQMFGRVERVPSPLGIPYIRCP